MDDNKNLNLIQTVAIVFAITMAALTLCMFGHDIDNLETRVRRLEKEIQKHNETQQIAE